MQRAAATVTRLAMDIYLGQQKAKRPTGIRVVGVFEQTLVLWKRAGWQMNK